MLRLSKSKYVQLCQCEKMLYLDKYKKELKVISPMTEEIFKMGNEVGDFAMKLFGSFVEVTTYDQDNNLDLVKMTQLTKQLLENNTSNICEASFIYEGLYCAVDILKKNEDGYDIYEVKSSTKVKDVHLIDVAYQKYLLEKCNVTVKNCYVVTINSKYERLGEIDVQKLFLITDVSNQINRYYQEVDQKLELAKKVLDSEEEPQVSIGNHCLYPYECMYKNYCFSNLKKPCVVDLYKLDNKFDLYHHGIISYEDVYKSKIPLNKIQKIQVLTSLKNRDEYCEKENLELFLKQINYPVAYLKIEAINPAIPRYDNTRPYSFLPFMYTCLVQTDFNLQPVTYQYIIDKEVDPRFDLASALKNALKDIKTIITFDEKEKYLIKSCAFSNPFERNILLSMINNIVEVDSIFKNGFLYHQNMNDDFSFEKICESFLNKKIDKDNVNYKYLDAVTTNNQEELDKIKYHSYQNTLSLYQLITSIKEK